MLVQAVLQLVTFCTRVSQLTSSARCSPVWAPRQLYPPSTRWYRSQLSSTSTSLLFTSLATSSVERMQLSPVMLVTPLYLEKIHSNNFGCISS